MAKRNKNTIASVEFSYIGTAETFQVFLKKLVQDYVTAGQVCQPEPLEIVQSVESAERKIML